MLNCWIQIALHIPPHPTMESARTKSLKCCPFCNTSFKKLGNHLPHCQERKGRAYSSLLSEKTLRKKNRTSGKKACPTCGKCFSRLNTHLCFLQVPTPPDEQPSSHTKPANYHSSNTVEPPSTKLRSSHKLVPVRLLPFRLLPSCLL